MAVAPYRLTKCRSRAKTRSWQRFEPLRSSNERLHQNTKHGNLKRMLYIYIYGYTYIRIYMCGNTYIRIYMRGIKCVSLVVFCNILIMQKCNPTRNLSNSQHIPCLTWKHTTFFWHPFLQNPKCLVFWIAFHPSSVPFVPLFLSGCKLRSDHSFHFKLLYIGSTPTQEQWHWDPTYTQQAMTFLFLDIFFSRNCGFLHFSLIFLGRNSSGWHVLIDGALSRQSRSFCWNIRFIKAMI